MSAGTDTRPEGPAPCMTGCGLRLGVAGLGRGFMLMTPTLARRPRLRLAAAE